MKTINTLFVLVTFTLSACGGKTATTNSTPVVAENTVLSNEDDVDLELDLTNGELKDVRLSSDLLGKEVKTLTEALDNAKNLCRASFDKRKKIQMALDVGGEATKLSALITALDSLITEAEQTVTSKKKDLSLLEDKVLAAEEALKSPKPISRDEFQKKQKEFKVGIRQLKKDQSAADNKLAAARQKLDGSAEALAAYKGAIGARDAAGEAVDKKTSERDIFYASSNPGVVNNKQVVDPAKQKALDDAKKARSEKAPLLKQQIASVNDEMDALLKDRKQTAAIQANDKESTKISVPTLPEGCAALGIK